MPGANFEEVEQLVIELMDILIQEGLDAAKAAKPGKVDALKAKIAADIAEAREGS